MKRGKKLLFVTLLFALVTALGIFTACGGGNTPPPAGGAYYLSVKAEGEWSSYASDSEVPATHKFTKNDDAYKLTIALEENDLIRVAQVGVAATYNTLFSSKTNLEETTDGIKVKDAGTYTLTFTPADETITYQYQAPSDLPPAGGGAEILLVEIDGDATRSVTYGETLPLTATVYYDDGTDAQTGITWESTQTSVATVNATTGVVTPVTAGTTQIKAKAGDVYSTPVTVKVLGKVELSETSKTLPTGGTFDLTATALGGAQIVMWSSSSENVAVVDTESDGNTREVTALTAGDAEIIVTYKAHPDDQVADYKFARCAVKVANAVTDIALSASTLTVAVDGQSALTVNFTPSNATNQNYSYSLSTGGETYIQVTDDEEGTLTIKGLQVTTDPVTLTVTSEDGSFEASCDITVIAAGSVIVSLTDGSSAVSKIDLHSNLNDVYTTTLYVSIENGTIESVEWSSSVTDVATVSGTEDNGTYQATVTGAKFGSATITAQVQVQGEASKRILTCQVVVAPDKFFMYGELPSNSWFTDTTDPTFAGMIFAQSGTTYTLDVTLAAGNIFRIGHTDAGFADSSLDNWAGLGWNFCGSTMQNMSKGSNATTSAPKWGWENNINVNVSGNYHIIVDLSDGVAVISATLNYLSITDIAISATEASIKAGGTNSTTVTLDSVTPSNATYEASDVTWSYTYNGVSESNVTIVESPDKSYVTITVNDDAEDGTIVVTCTVRDTEKSTTITVSAKTTATVDPESVEFEQAAYFVNVADSWTFTPTATVYGADRALATTQAVTFTCANNLVTVNNNGSITGTRLGTFTITVTVNGTQITDTATVTFYSSSLYIAGDHNATSSWGDTPTTQDYFTDYENGHTIFTLVSPVTEKVQIIFTGMDSGWNGALTSAYLSAFGDGVKDGNDIKITQGATIVVDLSGSTPKVTVLNNGITNGAVLGATLKGDDGTTKNASATEASGTYTVTLTTHMAEGETAYALEVVGLFETYAIVDDTANLTGSSISAWFANVAGGGFKCLLEGNYTFTITCETNGASLSVAVSREGADSNWVEDSTYSLSKWSVQGTVSNEKFYTKNGEYKANFTYTTGVNDNMIGFAIVIGDDWNSGAIIPRNCTTYTNNSAALLGASGDGNFTAPYAGAIVNFEVIFTVDGSVSIDSITVTDKEEDYVAGAALLGGTSTLVTVAASSSGSGYTMIISKALETDVTYSFVVVGVKDGTFGTIETITSVTYDGLAAGTNGFTCTAVGTYEFTITCGADGSNAVATVTSYTAPVSSWETDTAPSYTLSKWGDSLGTIGDTAYYKAGEQYKLCFSYTIGADDWNIGFAIVISGKWNNIVPNNLGGADYSNTSDALKDDGGAKFWAGSSTAGLKADVEAIFTISGDTVTFVSVKITNAS